MNGNLQIPHACCVTRSDAGLLFTHQWLLTCPHSGLTARQKGIVRNQHGSQSFITAVACSKQIRESIHEKLILYKSVTGLKYKNNLLFDATEYTFVGFILLRSDILN